MSGLKVNSFASLLANVIAWPRSCSSLGNRVIDSSLMRPLFLIEYNIICLLVSNATTLACNAYKTLNNLKLILPSDYGD